mgnify:CR=1 FL=1
MHAIYNVADLSPYLADNEFDLGTNCLQEEGNDGGSMAVQTPQGSKASSSSDAQVVPSGPMTRARAKKFRESFEGIVREV